ncbi:hypothetical protein OG609_35160 [Streptomyces sp. NBC_01224]|uniref:hypothetical protein n=1 Tax=unclassified Streptomyces TaxID=2593676 RepID=UPI002E14CC3E|nr:hypothetical protein OG609_35160 [Streptomyces sp. NBC_01224]
MTRRKAPPPEWAELAVRLTARLPELPEEDAARIVAGMTPAARTRIRDHLRPALLHALIAIHQKGSSLARA